MNSNNLVSDGQSNSVHSNTTEKTKSSALKALLSAPNPYGLPLNLLNTGLLVDNLPIWHFPVRDDPVTHVKKIQALPMRKDDIFIASFMKCGTHWLSEILYMLTRGSTDYSNKMKESAMLELVDDLPSLELESTLSPRILNSHLYMAHLPKEIVQKKVKMIHLMRNAKDTAVSWYHHIKEMSVLDTFSFDKFLQAYMLDDHIPMSHQLNFLRQFSVFEKTHPDHPIMHIHYEDLKNNPVDVILRLASFIRISASETFCQQVAEACSFENMKRDNERREMPENINGKISKGAFYRKGIIGDWKNCFTIAQSESFDEFIQAQERKGCPYTLKGEL
ncbi:sulfotransferase 1c4 [Plakobranchus ocellatus]|uniref:Sulfotransferase 1c4 n=1 Tax=Plakobranchus ocellatus TaxID=259542 RepID=A0AAV4A2K6_9GAST|nr:sulfotransferase 1c4 [Plakobranchus ocellatus]